MTDVQTTTENKKPRKTERAFIAADGSETKRPTGATVGFRIKELSTNREVKRSFTDYPENIRTCAMGFGFVTNLGNTIGAKNADPEDLFARDELLMNGEWAEAGEGGPRISVLVQAMLRAAQSAGKTVNQEQVETFVKGLDEAGRKSIKEDPPIKAAFDAILAENAAARAAESAKAASGVASSFLNNLPNA
jgi:hypothetical protein